MFKQNTYFGLEIVKTIFLEDVSFPILNHGSLRKLHFKKSSMFRFPNLDNLSVIKNLLYFQLSINITFDRV